MVKKPFSGHAERHSSEEFARYACKCGAKAAPRYNPLHDDVMCRRCKRWITGALPDPDPYRPLMPFAGEWVVTREQRARRRRRIADAIRRGVPFGEAVGLFGVSIPSVKLACAEFGVSAKVAPYGNSVVGSMRILRELLDPRWTLSDVARRLGLSRQRIHQVFRDAVLAGVPGLPQRGAEESRQRDE